MSGLLHSFSGDEWQALGVIVTFAATFVALFLGLLPIGRDMRADRQRAHAMATAMTQEIRSVAASMLRVADLLSKAGDVSSTGENKLLAAQDELKRVRVRMPALTERFFEHLYVFGGDAAKLITFAAESTTAMTLLAEVQAAQKGQMLSEGEAVIRKLDSLQMRCLAACIEALAVTDWYERRWPRVRWLVKQLSRAGLWAKTRK